MRTLSVEEYLNYCDILGVAPGASVLEIRESYRDLAKVWHPDKFERNSRVQKKAEERFKAINAAYELLKDGLLPPGFNHPKSEQPKEATPPVSPSAESAAPPQRPSSSPRPSLFGRWPCKFALVIGLVVFLFGTGIESACGGKEGFEIFLFIGFLVFWPAWGVLLLIDRALRAPRGKILKWLGNFAGLSVTCVILWAQFVQPELNKKRASEDQKLREGLRARVEFGVLNDDVVLENNSSVVMTNITVRVAFFKNEGTPILATCSWNRINAHDMHAWINAISIPQSHFRPGSYMTIECDQLVKPFTLTWQ